MVVHVATSVAPDLASQSAAVAGSLIPFNGWMNTALRSAHMMQFYMNCLYNYDLISNRPVHFGIGTALYTMNNGALREIARFAFAARLIMRCIDDGKKLVQQAGRISTAVQCTFPIPTHYLKTKGALDASNPEATQHLSSHLSFLPEAALTCALKVEQLATTTGSFLWGCFSFLPNLLAVGQVLTFDTTTEMTAFAGLIDNAGEVFDRLTDNRGALADEIEQNRDAITKLLETTQSPYKVEELYRFVANSELPARARRVIKHIREVTIDSALSVEYVARGTVSQPLRSATRRVQQVPLLPSKNRYAHDDNTPTHSTWQTSDKSKDI